MDKCFAQIRLRLLGEASKTWDQNFRFCWTLNWQKKRCLFLKTSVKMNRKQDNLFWTVATKLFFCVDWLCLKSIYSSTWASHI